MTRPYSRHQADVAERPCTRCGTTLPLDDFPANLRMRDGHSSWCRPCAAARTREWRAGIRDEYNARRRVNREARPCDGCGLEITGRIDRRFCCVGCRTYHPEPGDPMAATWAAAHRHGQRGAAKCAANS